MKASYHICFISREYPPETGWGGIGSYVYEMAHGLRGLGHQVSVISQAVGTQPSIYDDNGVTVCRVPVPPMERLRFFWRYTHHIPLFAIAAFRAFRMIHRRHPVDIIEAAEYNAESFVAQLLRVAPPIVVRLHTPMKAIDLLNGKRPSKKFLYWCENWAITHAAAVSAPSHAVVQKTFEEFPILRREVSVIPNPLNTALYRCNGVRKKPETVLFVGRLEKRKGIDVLSGALPLILDRRPTVQFWFVGGDGLHESGLRWSEYIRTIVPEDFHEQLIFQRVERSKLPGIMAAAALAVFPSHWENFPYVLLETMSSGTPALVSVSGGMPEIVDDSVNGFYLEHNTPECLAHTVLRILSNEPRLRIMGERASEKIRECFDTQVIVPRMLLFYEQVMKNHHAKTRP